MRISEDIKAIRIGNREIREVRLGDAVIWRKGQNAPPGIEMDEEEPYARTQIGED